MLLLSLRRPKNQPRPLPSGLPQSTSGKRMSLALRVSIASLSLGSLKNTSHVQDIISFSAVVVSAFKSRTVPLFAGSPENDSDLTVSE